jgi:large subunit ribosomal protein L24
METTGKIKIRRGDQVAVTAGKDRGKKGRVLEVDRDKGRVIVEGCNMVKKAIKKRKQTDRGGISEVEASLNLSNVQIICKKCGPTRIGYKIDGDKKIRVCRKCGEAL